MNSVYVQQLEAWIKAKGLKKADSNLAEFLAVREIVQAHLADGYTATVIHEFLREGYQINFCYDTFLKYVHRYVQPPRKGPKAKASKSQSGLMIPTAKPAASSERTAPQEPVGFTFNASPKKEDLL